MNTVARTRAMRAIARITHIDISAAMRLRRHNPILDSEISIEEELINLKESLDTYHAAQDSVHTYPKMYAHLHRERRAIMQHCMGLLVRMMQGRTLMRDYTKRDVDEALKRLVFLVVRECRWAGKSLDKEMIEAFRPYLTIRDRVGLRDFNMDLLITASQWPRAQMLFGRLPLLKSR